MRIKKQDVNMIDVSAKADTARRAVATATVVLGKKAFQIWQTEGSPKGDVLAVARVAGIMAAKNTPTAIPLCHPLILNKVNIDFAIEKKAFMITIISEVLSCGKTGVEMEALHAASVAALTVYDMLKCMDKGIVIKDVCLLEKSGGKSGDYQRKK